MPSKSTELKQRLEYFLVAQQASLDQITAAYDVERTRLEAQISTTTGVLAQWDANTDTMINGLAAAGIAIKLE